MRINPKLCQIVNNIKMVVFDFDGVFTDNRVLVLQDGSEGVFCNRSDGWGIKTLKEQGMYVLVISTEKNPIVTARCKKLCIDCIQGCENKFRTLQNQAEKFNVGLDKIAFLGNDVNDLECLKKVGLPACVSDSHPDILKICRYITKYSGGNGAVREFCDFVIKVKNGKLS